MHAPARITSARFGCRPTICRRSSGVELAVELDLPVDLGEGEDGALDDLRVVGREPVLDRGHVRHAAAHPDHDLGKGTALESPELETDRVAGGDDRELVDGAVEPEMLREACGADVDAELFHDLVTFSEGELRAAAAGVEDEPGASRKAEAGDCSQVCEPGFFVAWDHLDLDARPLAHRGDEVCAVRGDAEPGRADGRDLGDAVSLRLVDHAGDRLAVRSIGSAPRAPLSSRPSPSLVTSARSVTVVQAPSAARSPTWNLTEFVPTSRTA